MKRARSYIAELKQSLKDPLQAAGYLAAAYQDNDPRVFLLALRDVIEARAGISQAARLAKLDRRHLYVMLSRQGNPEWFSINRLLKILGIRISFEPAPDQEIKAAA
jgi:probable addiction module antidote protein